MKQQPECLVAKATIDEVSQASPAEAAGLRVGDQVCRFGPVSIQDCPSISKHHIMPWVIWTQQE